MQMGEGARMKDHPARPMVLIVDKDLGFVAWLAEIFSDAGCDVVPALNCGQARSLIIQFKLQVDLIVVDPALARVSEIVPALCKENRLMKVVAIRNGASDAQEAIIADWTLVRPSGWESTTRQDWLARVRTILSDGHGKDGK
jgi:DNA-binding response OmpR family regulator